MLNQSGASRHHRSLSNKKNKGSGIQKRISKLQEQKINHKISGIINIIQEIKLKWQILQQIKWLDLIHYNLINLIIMKCKSYILFILYFKHIK